MSRKFVLDAPPNQFRDKIWVTFDRAKNEDFSKRGSKWCDGTIFRSRLFQKLKKEGKNKNRRKEKHEKRKRFE